MKIFFDTEFIEDGKTIELISIGMVREDGAVLYLVSNEFDESRANDWVKENVLNQLGTEERFSRKEIAQKILEFAGDKPEFWAYYADYDWVVLCQLFGRMIDLPKHFPMFCMDLKQEMQRLGYTKDRLDNAGVTCNKEHNALEDAIWTKRAYIHLSYLNYK